MFQGPSQRVERTAHDGADRTVEYHAPSGTYRSEFDFATRSVSDAVVWTVASARDCDPVELPPLYETVDPDELDSLFTSRVGSDPRDSARVELVYADCAVTVHSHGTVEAEPI